MSECCREHWDELVRALSDVEFRYGNALGFLEGICWMLEPESELREKIKEFLSEERRRDVQGRD